VSQSRPSPGPTVRPPLGWTIVVPWLVTVGMGVALGAIGGQVAGLPGTANVVAVVAGLILIGLWGVANGTVGAMIAWRRPGNRIGRILQAGGLLVSAVFLGFAVSAIRTPTAGSDDLLAAVAAYSAGLTTYPAVFIAFPLVGIMFPDGRPPGRRWWWPVGLVAGGLAAITVLFALAAGPLGDGLADNPFGVLPVPRDVIAAGESIGQLLLVVSMGLAVSAIAVRWRRGNPVERAQLKWLLGAVAVAAIVFPLSFGSGDEIAFLLAPASALLVPVAIGIAILRYRLYEIDRIISRTLSYGALTLVLVGVYAAGFALLQAVLVPFTRGGGPIAVAASSLAAFALFQPLRQRLQGTMDQRFNRSRYDAQRTVEAFAAELRDEVDLERLGGQLRTVVGRSLAPTSVGVWVRPSERTSGR
jgi:hypothetical protein